ncbi:MAG: hypothetical protein KC635_03115, partial [Myxococcales bacterium]|nr:hypothetical protein [Myxococcales bacterium]
MPARLAGWMMVAGLVLVGGCLDDGATPGLEQSDALGADVLGADASGADARSEDAVAAGGCVDDAECVGVLGELAPCEVALCHQASGQCVVGDAPELTPCDDGDACSRRSFCNQGACEAFPSDVTDCDDGDPCTADTCRAGGGCEHQPVTTGGCGTTGGGGSGGGCGDGVCDQQTFEPFWCPDDCGNGGGGSGSGGATCGDGVCDQAALEQILCPEDCGNGGGGSGGGAAGCGDGVCDQQ